MNGSQAVLNGELSAEEQQQLAMMQSERRTSDAGSVYLDRRRESLGGAGSPMPNNFNPAVQQQMQFYQQPQQAPPSASFGNEAALNSGYGMQGEQIF